MVKLRRDSKGNYIARKRLPEDVRAEYGARYGAHHEAKFFAPASDGFVSAKGKFHEWDAEVTQRIDLIRKEQKGEGIDLTFKQAVALAGDWYRWFVAKFEDNPGDPIGYEQTLWNIIHEMSELLPNRDEELEKSYHDLSDWTAYPEVREGMRPIISDLGKTAQFLAHRKLVLSNAARELFLDQVLDELRAALMLLERRAKGDYSEDERHASTPSFAPLERSQPSGLTPRQLFEAWVIARKPAHSSVESWQPVFNALTSYFPDRDAASLSPEEAQVWTDQLITDERSAATVRNTWLKATKAVYTWGQRAKKVSGNPFADVFVTVPRRTSLRPKYFYEQERAIILNAASAITDTSKPDMAARRWVPWLLFYTGARPQDMTQLRGVDVERVDTIWTFNLTPEAGTIKGGLARRVPIHSDLIDQGFLDFVNARGRGPLFYRARTKETNGDLLTRKKSPAVQVRQRLAHWVRAIGVTHPKLSPLHAWRHTFKQIGRSLDLNNATLDYICGHAPASEGDAYGEPTLAELARVIEKFPRFDASATEQREEE